jgi:hypothetical protein
MRDASRDGSLGFSIADYYYDGRHAVAADLPVLQRLIEVVDSPNALDAMQWAQLYSVALGFRPDLILELGRGKGNSTALFSQAASRLPSTRVVSLCLSTDWHAETAAKIARFVESSWFSRLDARIADIVLADYESILESHERVLVFWDAHGFEIAEIVLGNILPRLVGRPHLIIMHDISDNRYASVAPAYDGAPLWKASERQRMSGEWTSRVNIGWMNSVQDQVIALVDFSTRNAVEVGSADHEYWHYFAAHPERADEMRRTLGHEFFQTTAHWAFLSLNGRQGPFTFPTPENHRGFAHSVPVSVDPPSKWPATIVTEPQPWAYAATFAWRPGGSGRISTPAWLRLQVSVEGGLVGIGLLSADGKQFVQSQAVCEGSTSSTVLLSIADITSPGRLVFHTWQQPVGARIRIEDISVVW